MTLVDQKLTEHKLKCSKLRFQDGSSLHWIPISGLAWSLYKCAALWRAVYGPSATERPLKTLGTIHDDNGISSRFLGYHSLQDRLSCLK